MTVDACTAVGAITCLIVVKQYNPDLQEGVSR